MVLSHRGFTFFYTVSEPKTKFQPHLPGRVDLTCMPWHLLPKVSLQEVVCVCTIDRVCVYVAVHPTTISRAKMRRQQIHFHQDCFGAVVGAFFVRAIHIRVPCLGTGT